MQIYNGHLLLTEQGEESIIQMPEKYANPVGKGKISFTSQKASIELGLETIEEEVRKELTVYYKAAEGMLISDLNLVAIPYTAVLAIEDHPSLELATRITARVMERKPEYKSSQWEQWAKNLLISECRYEDAVKSEDGLRQAIVDMLVSKDNSVHSWRQFAIDKFGVGNDGNKISRYLSDAEIQIKISKLMEGGLPTEKEAADLALCRTGTPEELDLEDWREWAEKVIRKITDVSPDHKLDTSDGALRRRINETILKWKQGEITEQDRADLEISHRLNTEGLTATPPADEGNRLKG